MPAFSTFAAIAAIASTVVSFAGGLSARKRQEAARRAAEERNAAAEDAAKGFEVTVEGVAAPLPILYGRNKVGGVRVYHNTLNNFFVADPATGGSVVQINMNADIAGEKHEFLMVQQVLCKGRVSNWISTDIDEQPINTPEYQHGIRIHLYPGTSVYDPMAAVNAAAIGDSSRYNSLFPGLTYATVIYRLNRDDQQYNGVPECQFYVEGEYVEDIATNGTDYWLVGVSYSNNPARCLLNYLLNDEYGRGLPVSKIGLKSFYQAIQLCNEIVLPSVPKDGKIWKGKLGERQVKRFECNIAIDTSAPVRDNINKILETMDLAELVWVDGRYELSLIYPYVHNSYTPYNVNVLVQGYRHGQLGIFRSLLSGNVIPLENTGAWSRDPIAADITDDDIMRDTDISVVWPDAQKRLNFATIHFRNESKDFADDSVSWPSKYKYIAGPNKDRGNWDAATAYIKSDMVNDGAYKYQLLVDGPRIHGVPPSGDTAWRQISDIVYSTYKHEDSEMPLEADFTETGITDYYHALAKAEQRVRFSRDAPVYVFTVSRRRLGLGPGDLLYVNSEMLYIPGELLRIESIKVTQAGDLAITAYKFDARMLAWNVGDSEVVMARNVFDSTIGQAQYLTVTSDAPTQPEALFRLGWARPWDARVVKFSVKYCTIAPNEISVNTVWTDLGSTRNEYLDIPFLNEQLVTFTVVAESSTGRAAPKFTATSKWPTLLVDTSQIVLNNITNAQLNIGQDGIILSWEKTYSNTSAMAEVRIGMTWNTSVLLEQTANTIVKIPFRPEGLLRVFIKSFNRNGVYSASAIQLDLNITKPSAPVVTAQVIDNYVLLYWNIPASMQPVDTYEVWKGDVFATADFIGDKNGTFTTIFETISGDYTYWITAVDKGGNRGYPASVYAVVSEPPDYNFIADYTTTFQSENPSPGIYHTVAKVNTHAKETLVLPSYSEDDWFKHFSRSLVSHDMSTWNKVDVVTTQGSYPFVFHLQLAITGPYWYTNSVYADAAPAGKTYTFSIELKRGTYTGDVILHLVDGSGSGSQRVTNTITLTDNWVRYSVTQTFTAGAAAGIAFIVQPINGTPANTTIDAAKPQLVLGASPAYWFDSPQHQIDSGYPYYLQPVPTSGSYTEVLDYGPGFENNTHMMKLSVIISYKHIEPGCSITIGISHSVNGTTWTAPIYGDFIYANGFRYMKVVITATSDTRGFREISSIRYLTDTKLKNESGTATCAAGDSGGTYVTLSQQFWDILSIAITPKGNAAMIPVYDFVDTPNPTGFYIYLFNTSGTRISGTVGWAVKGY